MHGYWFSLQDQRPTNATYGYDFRETSAASHAIVVQKVRKADFEDKNYSGTPRHATQYALTEIKHIRVLEATKRVLCIHADTQMLKSGPCPHLHCMGTLAVHLPQKHLKA